MAQYKKEILLGISLLLLSALLTLSLHRREDEALADRLAPDILRFHVLANSSRTKDQELKLKVKSMLLEKIYEENGENSTKASLTAYLTENKKALETSAEDYMKSLGYNYTAYLDLEKAYFPKKTYGDMTFPCGTYDAARLIIGKGKGRNWWCVLYPSLCFVNEAYGVVPDSSKEQLKSLLVEEDYTALLHADTENVTIQCRFLLPKLLPELPSEKLTLPPA